MQSASMVQTWGVLALQYWLAEGRGPQIPVVAPETANWQSVPVGHTALLIHMVGVAVAGPVGITEDDVVLTPAVVVTGFGTGIEVVVTTGGMDEVVVTTREVVVVVVAVVVAGGGLGDAEEVDSPGPSGLSGSGSGATMPVGAVARRVTAHSTKREVALDNFMVEGFSGGDTDVGCIRGETNKVVQEQGRGKNIEKRKRDGDRGRIFE